MRPLAPLDTELRITGIGGVVIGCAALAGAIARGVEPAQAALPFSALALLFALIQRSSALKWFLSTAASAPDLDPGATFEAPGRTWARNGLTLLFWVVLVGMAIGFSPGVAGPMGGLILGVAAIDVRTATAVAGYREDGRQIWREIGTSWLASGRRPLFTGPARD